MDLTKFNPALAGFVYHFETFQFSQCKKKDNERVKLINENDILVARIDEESDAGYHFSVRQCELIATSSLVKTE
jgi:hypothetical protein